MDIIFILSNVHRFIRQRRRPAPPVAAPPAPGIAALDPRKRWHAWLDTVPPAERDGDAVALRAAVEHFGVTGPADRYELLVTHAFVIGWFVRHVLDAPVWRWIGLNHDNCAITVVQWDSDRPPTLISYNDTGHL